MKIITISGKSGSGKTYIAKILSDKINATYIDVDKISHEILEKDIIKNKVLEIFGNNILENNKINTKKLGQIVFCSAIKLDKLNTICKPEIQKAIDKIIKNDKIAIIDYALAPKMKYFKDSIKILVVAKDETRKNRILNRDNITKKYFDLREQNALNYNEYNFDYIINNETNCETEIDKVIKKENLND